MSTGNVNPAEVAKFERLASRWWDSEGESRPLHDLNPVRLGYIAERAVLKGARVVDVGCGGGLLSEAMASAGADVVGIDLAPAVLEVARLHLLESGLKVDYRETGAEALAQTMGGEFDVVTCLEMLEHVPDPASVIRACAEPRPYADETWISPAIIDAFCELHDMGFAHSVEAWQDGSLVGGVFGMALGGYFAAESMFHRCRDASKAALCHLVEHLGARGHSLLDIQVMSEHCASLGASEIPRDQFLRRLHTALASPTSFLPRQI